MKIHRLTLSNFQGIQAASFTFDGYSAEIFGDNATGKTTIANAWSWLLFDRPATGEKGFSPKPRTDTGDGRHNTDTTVEAAIDTPEGFIEIRKTLSEIWTRKTGQARPSMTGHETSYTWNGEPVKATEWAARIAGIAGPAEEAQVLTFPLFFGEALHWETRRRLLLSVLPEISDRQIIEAEPELAGLLPLLFDPATGRQIHTPSALGKIAAAEKTAANARLKEIPARIDEATRAMPQELPFPAESLEALQAELDEIKARAAAVKATENTEKTAAQAELEKARREYATKASDAMDRYRTQAIEARARMEAAKTIWQAKTDQKTNVERRLQQAQADRARFAEEYKAASVQEWAGDETCPFCKQAIPADQIEAAKAEFNQKKAEQLRRILETAEAQAGKQVIADLTQAVETAKAEWDTAAKGVAAAKEATEAIKAPEFHPFEETADGQALQMAVDYATDSAPADNPELLELEQEADEIAIKVEAHQAAQAAQKARETQVARIKELEAEEQETARLYEKAEATVYLCENFERARAARLDSEINRKFETVKFRLFSEQINGGLTEVCDPMIPSPDGALVPFASANNAARIKAGLEIIDRFAEAWDRSLPVFVDNAESITERVHANGQTIRLIVSGLDRKLRTVCVEE